MNAKNLKFMLAEGEGLFIEFKERPDKSLARELVAFANASGGRIFVGVADDGRIEGVQDENRLRSQIQDVARNCDPPIPMSLSMVENVLVIEIPESGNKPHACSDGFFMRIGANCQKMSRDEVFSMGIRSGKLRFDEQVCQEFDLNSDVDVDKVQAYLESAGLSTDLELNDALANLEVLSNHDGNSVMTNAGILFFAENPQRFLKSATVVCALYQGHDKARILDRKAFNGGILANVRDAVNYILQHIDVRYDITSLERTEVPQYPEAAIREAVVNAIMHRDYYDASGDTMIEMFQDRIMVSNPGGLVPWLRPEDFGKYSRTRNRVVASLLMRTSYAEKMGTGILRINGALVEAGLSEAEFSFDEFNFSITLLSSNSKAFTGEATGEATQETT